MSTPRFAGSGAPQGGVLSPLLFNIYCFKLPKLILECGVSCCAFADDFKLYSKVSTPDEQGLLQNATNAVFNWSRHWKLPLSEEKTKVPHIGGKNSRNARRIGSCDVVSVGKIRDRFSNQFQVVF